MAEDAGRLLLNGVWEFATGPDGAPAGYGHVQRVRLEL